MGGEVMNRQRIQAGNGGGFTLIEVLVAVLIVVVVSMAVIQLQHAIGRSTLSINDKTFATMKAVQIMEELRTKTSNATQGALVVLNEYDDHGAFNPDLTVESVTSPASPVSGNKRTPTGGWVYYRSIKVEALPDNLYARRVYVSVFKSSGPNDSGPILLSQTVGLFRDLNPAREYGQYYDLYLLKPENVIPGDGPGRASHSHQMVQAQVADLMNRNPGLNIRLKPITRVSYGRDPLYMPYTTRNLSMRSLNPIPGVYFYPGYDDPYNNRGQITAEDIRGRVNIDGTPTNIASYPLADRYNHAVRYPELLRLKSAYGHNDENQVPSWHEILEDMVSNPVKYRNAMFMNLLGNNFFMPALRNYSDPCREPVSYSNVRLVSHPESLEYASGASIKLRVYGFATDPALFPTTATIPTATVFIRGNSSVTKVEKIIGNASVPYTTHTVTLVSSQCTIQPGYTAPDGTVGTLVTLYNTPIRHDPIVVGTPTFTNDWMDCVVGAEQPPYGTLTQHTVSSLTASGGTGDLLGSADACHLVYKRLLGTQATMYAMITGIPTGEWSVVTLTIRESTAPGARAIQIGYQTNDTPSGLAMVVYKRRSINGGGWVNLDDSAGNLWRINDGNRGTVLWRLARNGNTFYIWFRLDGTWYQAVNNYSFTSTFSSNAVVGFALAGGWSNVTAHISSITIVGTTQGKPDTSGTLGLPSTRRLYGMEYIPCPVGTAGFDTLANGGDQAKNTARWIITVNPSYDWDIDGDGTTDGLVEFQTRIGTNLAAGTTTYQPYNISRTYAWLQGRAPFTERFQFNGDPRYCPYLDVKLNHGYNWYFCAVPPTDGYTGYPYAQNGWAHSGVIAANEPRLDCDGDRYAQLLRRGLLNSRIVFCTLMHEFGMRLLFGGETWMTAAKSRPWSQTGTGSSDITSSEEHYANDAYSRLRLIASTASALPPAWYAKPWLGELFPDYRYTVWTGTGNLPTGQFWRAKYVQCDSARFTYDRACWGGGFGESVLNCLPTYTQPGGSIVGTYGHWTDFDSGPGYNADGNPNPRSLAGATPALDLVQSAFNMVLITAEQVRCPIALNRRVNHVNSAGETMSGASYYPPGWTAYAGERTTAEIVDINGKMRIFYCYNWGGGVTDFNRDFYSNFTVTLDLAASSACHMVLSGLSHHTAIAHGAFAKAQLLQTINTLFDGGLMTGHKKIRQQPSVLITSPTVGSEYRRSQTSAITVSWNPNRWVRWDGLDYNSDYTALYPNNTYTDNTTMLEYKVMYSPNGSSWYLCDSPSFPLTTAGSRTDRNVTKPNAATAAPTSFTWNLPTPMASGMYWIRVECYSYDRWPHYSYDQIQIKIRQ